MRRATTVAPLLLAVATASVALSFCALSSAATTTKKSAPAKSVAPKPSVATPAKQDELQSEQRVLQQELARLKKQLAASENSQSEAADSLKGYEASISDTNRKLRELATARDVVQTQIEALQSRGRNLATRQSAQEKELAAVVRQQYIVSQREPWQDLIAGESPDQIDRDLQYLAYIAKARSELIGQLRGRREELSQLEAESQVKRDELAVITADEEKNQAQQLKQQAARRDAMNRLSKQISTQRQSIAKMERDEQRLTGLIEQLNKVLAEQARREAQRQAKASPSKTKPAPNAPREQVAAADAPATGSFGLLRGHLALPVKGEISARFGSARQAEGGVSAPTWKGLFIRAREGSEVHAVGNGQVVFADWMRGFGNLIILDHGDGYLSVYGNSESLFKNVGDRVSVGETIASVGNTGGNAEAGLYFELRFQGRPFDPLKWAAAR